MLRWRLLDDASFNLPTFEFSRKLVAPPRLALRLGSSSADSLTASGPNPMSQIILKTFSCAFFVLSFEQVKVPRDEKTSEIGVRRENF
jgi:hypothetical protein